MNINTQFSGTQAIIVITGIVESIAHSKEITDEIKHVFKSAPTSVRVEFADAFVIPSTLIGGLVKLVNEHTNHLRIVAKDDSLFNLLERLQLLNILNVTR
jgi:hypothetical protein